MNFLTRHIITIIALLCAGCATTTSISNQPDSSKTITLDSSQIFDIYSPTYKQNYRIQIRLPASYPSNAAKKYPVIIKLDGQWDFLLAASVYNGIYFDGQMPEAILVGIDWGNVAGNIHEIRARDLLPVAAPSFANSGHAKTFVNVIATEIIPALEKRLRLNGQRFLMGGSWSGLFATYALLEHPQTFDGAIAIGGDYEAGGDVIYQQIKALAGTSALKNKRLYIGVGKLDATAPAVLRYAKALQEAPLPGFHFKLDYLAGFGHSGMNTPGYASGYQYLFERENLLLSAATLAQHAGVYQAEDDHNNKIILSVKEQQLTVEAPTNDIFPLWAKSTNDFYRPGVFYNVTFENEKMHIETFFWKATFQKID